MDLISQVRDFINALDGCWLRASRRARRGNEARDEYPAGANRVVLCRCVFCCRAVVTRGREERPTVRVAIAMYGHDVVVLVGSAR